MALASRQAVPPLKGLFTSLSVYRARSHRLGSLKTYHRSPKPDTLHPMSIPDSITLKKAMKIASKIERLQQKLHELLGDTLELPAATVIMKNQLLEASQTPRRRGRPPGSGRKFSADGTSTSKLAGRPRPASPSGPLAPAVVRVLHRYNRPMKVTEILIGLEQDNYIWTAKNPKQTLYVRIGKLAGVNKTGEGLYVAEGIVPTGIVPEVVSTTSLDHAASAPVSSFGSDEAAPAAPASY